MKKVFIFCFISLLLLSSSADALSANVIKASVLYGGLQTPNTNIYERPNFKSFHEVGGFGYRLGFIHLVNNRTFNIPYHWRVGIEGDYSNFADNTYGYLSKVRYTYSSNALSALAVIQYIFSNKTMIFTKGGMARVVQSLHQTNRTTSINKLHPEFALGAGLIVNKHIQISSSYNYISGNKPKLGANSTVAPISTFAFTLNYLFKL